jgi:hypothetical protein
VDFREPLHEYRPLSGFDLRERYTHSYVWFRVSDLADGGEFGTHVSYCHADVCPGGKWVHRVDITAVEAQVACTGINARVQGGFEQFHGGEKGMARFTPVFNVHVWRGTPFGEDAASHAGIGREA